METGKGSGNRTNNAGFTLSELAVVIVVAGILSMLAVSVVSHIGDIRAQGAIDQVVGHLRYMQSLAMDRNTKTWIVFDADSESYTAYIEDPDNPGRAHRTTAVNPLNYQDLTVQLDSGFFSGIALSSAVFNGENEIAFDHLGRPLDEDENVLSSEGAITFSDGSRITVVPETGYAYLN